MNEPTHQRPIFYDPGQKRWPLVRNGLLSMAALLCVLSGLLIVSVVFHPVLPALGLRPTEPTRGPRPAPRRESSEVTGSARTAFDETKQQRHQETGRVPPAAVSLARGTVPPGQPPTFGYSLNCDPRSPSSLQPPFATPTI